MVRERRTNEGNTSCAQNMTPKPRNQELYALVPHAYDRKYAKKAVVIVSHRKICPVDGLMCLGMQYAVFMRVSGNPLLGYHYMCRRNETISIR